MANNLIILEQIYKSLNFKLSWLPLNLRCLEIAKKRTQFVNTHTLLSYSLSKTEM